MGVETKKDVVQEIYNLAYSEKGHEKDLYKDIKVVYLLNSVVASKFVSAKSSILSDMKESLKLLKENKDEKMVESTFKTCFQTWNKSAEKKASAYYDFFIDFLEKGNMTIFVDNKYAMTNLLEAIEKMMKPLQNFQSMYLEEREEVKKIALASKKESSAVINIVEYFDKKLEQNRLRIEKLQQIANTLFTRTNLKDDERIFLLAYGLECKEAKKHLIIPVDPNYNI